jgi:hypothetical protein
VREEAAGCAQEIAEKMNITIITAYVLVVGLSGEMVNAPVYNARVAPAAERASERVFSFSARNLFRRGLR